MNCLFILLVLHIIETSTLLSRFAFLTERRKEITFGKLTLEDKLN